MWFSGGERALDADAADDHAVLLFCNCMWSSAECKHWMWTQRMAARCCCGVVALICTWSSGEARALDGGDGADAGGRCG